MNIRTARNADFPEMLRLNEEAVHFLSPLSPDRLADLHRRAAYAKIAEADGRIVAFLLAFRENAGYESPNYLWLAARHETFLYIDRIVVDRDRRGRGTAGRFYDDLESFAVRSGAGIVTGEVDILPPNPVSPQFHRGRGFVEVGRQWIGGGKKQVALMAKRVGGARRSRRRKPRQAFFP